MRITKIKVYFRLPEGVLADQKKKGLLGYSHPFFFFYESMTNYHILLFRREGSNELLRI